MVLKHTICLEEPVNRKPLQERMRSRRMGTHGPEFVVEDGESRSNINKTGAAAPRSLSLLQGSPFLSPH